MLWVAQRFIYLEFDFEWRSGSPLRFARFLGSALATEVTLPKREHFLSPDESCYPPLIMETLFCARTPSPAGLLFLAASAKGLVRLEFQDRLQKLPPSIELKESQEALAPYLRELDEYFGGDLREFSLPLDLRGTAFQLACWHALLKIPYGETRSYADIARGIGHPRAYRAVGMSNNRNPIAIVVPCHRVIASSGALCGYGGGLDIKSKLLALEQASLQRPYLPVTISA